MKKIFSRDLILRSIAAGFTIGLAGAASLFASSAITNTSPALLVKSLVFPVGLILVIMCGFSLFTGAVALLVDKMDFKEYLATLGVIWLCNFVGALLAALVTSLMAPDFVKASASAILQTKCFDMGFFKASILGICCNFLICLGITRAKAAKGALMKVVLLFIVVFLFVICGFEHSIANMFYIPFAMICNKTFYIDWLFWNLMPVTLGNLVGGWSLYLYDVFTD